MASTVISENVPASTGIAYSGGGGAGGTYFTAASLYGTSHILGIEDLQKAYEALISNDSFGYFTTGTYKELYVGVPCIFCEEYFLNEEDKKAHINEKHF